MTCRRWHSAICVTTRTQSAKQMMFINVRCIVTSIGSGGVVGKNGDAVHENSRNICQDGTCGGSVQTTPKYGRKGYYVTLATTKSSLLNAGKQLFGSVPFVRSYNLTVFLQRCYGKG